MPDIDLFVLGFIFEKPMYGYQISQKVEERRFHILRGIKKASIYKSLKKLEKNDLIVGKMISQENLPAKKVYSITEKGREEFKIRIKEKLLDVEEHPMFFWASLWIIEKAITKSTFRKILENRLKIAEKHKKQFKEKRNSVVLQNETKSKNLPFYGLRMFEMVENMILNEETTLKNILNDLEEGKGDEIFIDEREETKWRKLWLHFLL